MEVKKKFLNRIGAFLCALVVLVGCLGSTTNYYASSSIYIPPKPSAMYKNYIVSVVRETGAVRLYSSEEDITYSINTNDGYHDAYCVKGKANRYDLIDGEWVLSKSYDSANFVFHNALTQYEYDVYVNDFVFGSEYVYPTQNVSYPSFVDVDNFESESVYNLINKYGVYVVAEYNGALYYAYGISAKWDNDYDDVWLTGNGSLSNLNFAGSGRLVDGVWTSDSSGFGASLTYWLGSEIFGVTYNKETHGRPWHIVYSSVDVYEGQNLVLSPSFTEFGVSEDIPNYNAEIGWLKNVRESKVYDKVPLGEVVNDKFTSRWYFDDITTTGLSLSSGNYSINYYQERWLVDGYDLQSDVIERSERYLVGSYSIANGYIENYSEDINSTLASLGYEEPSSFDLMWGKFVNTHHYFQIVNNDTGVVGGYLHVYYTDDTGRFGTEYIGETLDNNDEFVEDGYRETIDDDSITSDDVESGFEDLENDDNVSLGDIDGVENVSGILTSYANQVADFSGALGNLLGSFPPWILVACGLGVCLIVVRIVFNVLS